jgi:hypothetical protein
VRIILWGLEAYTLSSFIFIWFGFIFLSRIQRVLKKFGEIICRTFFVREFSLGHPQSLLYRMDLKF